MKTSIPFRTRVRFTLEDWLILAIYGAPGWLVDRSTIFRRAVQILTYRSKRTPFRLRRYLWNVLDSSMLGYDDNPHAANWHFQDPRNAWIATADEVNR